MVLAGAMLTVLLISFGLTLVWPLLVRSAREFQPANESRFWLAIGVAPALVGWMVSLAFVAPGYVLFEPRHTGERISVTLAMVAGVAVLVLAGALGRSAVLFYRSAKLVRTLQRTGMRLKLEGVSSAAYQVPIASRLTTVVGLRQPTMFFSRAVIEALHRSELGAVVRHEQAHVSSRDNLASFFLEIAGWLSGNLIFLRLARAQWVEATEIAADDRAAQSPDDALSLMSALLKVGRLRDASPVAAGVGCSFLPKATKQQLKRRIEHLKAIADGEPRQRQHQSPVLVPLAGCIVVITFASMLAAPELMSWAHSVLEVLVKL